MYPHGGDSRRRRVNQPPLAPQHLVGIPQQGPGVIMPMPNQPVQILQQNQHQHHYQPQPSYPTGQQTSAQYVSPQQASSAGYHQQHQQVPFTHANTQVVLTNQAVNHGKHYREEYKVLKEQNLHEQQISYNYQQSSYNGQHPSQHIKIETAMAQSTSSAPAAAVVAAPTSSGSSGEQVEWKQGEEDASPDSTTKEPSSAQSAFGVKEKTPMCLVNELARYNKIIHQYRLTNEEGPAHKKSFTVTLTLGSEEYTAEGPSIKKAQHAAAAEALKETSYEHPTPKNNKHPHLSKSIMMPTVELNALAMKRGEPAIYKLIEHPPGHMYQQSYNFRRPFPPRGAMYGRGRPGADMMRNPGRMNMRPTYGQNLHFAVSLKVGTHEFLGEGNSPQRARHDAAAKALAHLRMLPLPETAAAITPDPDLDQELFSSIKSPISLVHEIALKRDLNVVFDVVSEKGPPHMKTFVTECYVGEFRSEGEGNGKKISKKRAAENMLSELKKLPPLSPSIACSISLSRLKRKPLQTKKKNRNLIKVTQEVKNETEATEEINPISRLIQIQQIKKEREPVYTLVEEKCMHKRREFIMEVAIGDLTARGTGPNKKLAKKCAAQKLLAIIEGQGVPDSTSSAANSSEQQQSAKGVETKHESSAGSSGRQLAPGLLLVSDQKGFATSSGEGEHVAKKVAEASASGGSNISGPTSSHPKGFGAKDQLLYLSKLLNFEVAFSDYPKANHREHLTLVSLSTDPPQVCHGSAATIEESHNEAAATALRALAEMGLDSVTSPQKDNQLNSSGKGSSMKK